ncbi:hypothetical protein L9F63_011582 [Diploptera punctata]|uniref:Uncharacterized protein n=1 Tax=Diploptera punctata TaxID=6984 RepID=A0AAD8EPF3_DIPPU|nr:hypothetical protein L9F63_011582 [Diploptera punctata]
MCFYFVRRLIVYIRQPNVFQNTWEQYLSPFNKGLWIAIAVIFVLLTFGLFATDYLGHLYADNRKDQLLKYTIVQSTFIVLAILCQQVSSYSATLISILTIRYQKLPFTSFKEMLEDGTYRLGLLQSSAELDYFEKSNDSLLQILNARMISPVKPELPKSHIEGLRRLCNIEKYAFLGPNSILKSLLKNISCPVIPIPQAYIPATSAMVIGKQSTYMRIFKHTYVSL